MTANANAQYRLPLLRKPFRTYQLLDKVREVLDGPAPSATGAWAGEASSKTDRLGALRAAVDIAHARYICAVREFNALMQDIPSGVPPSDGTTRIQQVSGIAHQAFEVYQRALKELKAEQEKSGSG
jgi:hypothetical protein